MHLSSFLEAELDPQSQSAISQMVVTSPTTSKEVHPSVMACQSFDMRHIPYNIFSHPYGGLATTTQHTEPSTQFLFLHNVLLQLLHEPS